ncbi:hypothetical protein [Shewanella algidipiscicola]|uniref:Uncharacterized protein n=1 Tax=Shewanella algidipiscicola TaxID=614070 RepID=A0ABQ4NTC9_9GAMM|nr:hypothetical protein [Shewanella algidipiscicola]GIU02747.1 hypothetical protein TUM4630_35010 [Shewanella algidipiscicola]
MRGWIILGAGAGLLYYLATETNKLDEPMAQADALMQKAERKLDSMTGTKIIKVDNHLSQLKAEIANRLNKAEQAALEDIFESEQSVMAYKQQYCGDNASRFTILSRDNQLFICDKLR